VPVIQTRSRPRLDRVERGRGADTGMTYLACRWESTVGLQHVMRADWPDRADWPGWADWQDRADRVPHAGTPPNRLA
jgi:hypothetical protein